MKPNQKITIQRMRDEGKTFTEIASTAKLTHGSVRTFVSHLGKDRVCLNCGNVVVHNPNARM